MGNKKCSSNSSDKGLTKKRTRPNRKVKKEEEFENIIKGSLPVLSDEKLYFDDGLINTFQNNKVEGKILRVVLPKIKIKCEPLNVEKIIDLENNETVTDVIKKIKKKPERKCRNTDSMNIKSTKSPYSIALEKVTKNSLKSRPAKNLKSSNKKLLEAKEAEVFDNLVVSSLENSKTNCPPSTKKIKILINGSQVTLDNESCLQSPSCIQEKTLQQNYQANTPQSYENQSSNKLNVDNSNIKKASNSSVHSLDDVSAFFELNDINLEAFAPSLEGISDKELGMKIKGVDERNKNIGEVTVVKNLCDNSTNSEDENQCNHNHGNYELESFNKITLQALVEDFIKNPQLNYLRENTALKKGLCVTWLSNNYMCSNKKCPYSHNACNFFTKKLKQYPSKFIMNVVVSMRNDILFVDVIMAAFKILSERMIPTIWVTFLIYFVFYVTEPSDSRFLKFWVNTARFFCQMNRNYGAADGFASLLSIFSRGEKSEEWKIIEFVKVIKQPPVEVSITYALLQPILMMNIPSQFLFEAIESCISTKKDLLKVYSIIIPKISFMSLPILVVELLLKFCETLEDEDLRIYADDVKHKIRPKVLSFKTKIIQQEYPLTAFFQKELDRNPNEDDSITCISEEKLQKDLATFGSDNNYFELQPDFYDLLTKTIKLSSSSIPSLFGNIDKGICSKEEDICERQINRIRQFFQDCQFDLLGKYLNELRPNVVERATEVILKLLFQMKISLWQVVDLVKIIVSPCKSENAAKIIASVSVTLILNLVRINEWEKAHVILTFCKEKEINLVTGKVFYLKESNTVTQCRIVLLFIEIYAYKSDYTSAVGLVKEYSLFSSDCSLWKAKGNPHDETIRVRILEDLLNQIICNQIIKVAYDLFEIIWKAQNQLLGSVDLRKYVNDILILLLNQNNEEAVNFYEKIKREVELSDTTARAILVTLVRQNHLSAAKGLLLSHNQNVYFLPEIQFGLVEVKISSVWLEEEIYVMFDAFFDLLAVEKQNYLLTDFDDLEVIIQIQKPNKVLCSSFRPLCLGIIKPFFKDACSRIQRVLQYQFNPPLKLIVHSSGLKLDEYTLKLHLEKRMNQN